jgi:soluble lytic murein transglycosylase-like protein
MQFSVRLSRLLSVAILSFVGFSTTAFADIYSLVEEDGTVRLSNVPDDPRYKLYMREGPERNKAPLNIKLRDKAAAVAAGKRMNQEYQEHILAAAKLHNIDPALVHAVIQVESGYNVKALSPKGAVGLMQLMPATGARYGVKAKDLRNPAHNIRAGTRYLADLLEMFGGDVSLALAGYNAGEGAVLKYGKRIPPYRETQAYVPRVMAFYDRWRTQ